MRWVPSPKPLAVVILIVLGIPALAVRIWGNLVAWAAGVMTGKEG